MTPHCIRFLTLLAHSGRERLLGDLGGPRQWLAEHGIQIDFVAATSHSMMLSRIACIDRTDLGARPFCLMRFRRLKNALRAAQSPICLDRPCGSLSSRWQA